MQAEQRKGLAVSCQYGSKCTVLTTVCQLIKVAAQDQEKTYPLKGFCSSWWHCVSVTQLDFWLLNVL